MASLVHAYNTDNYLAWVILARSTLEYAAVSYHFMRKTNGLRLVGPTFTASDLKAFERLMTQYAHGTRFNWQDLFAGNRSALSKDFEPSGSPKAVNVMTAISHLARRDERSKDVEIAYAMLSDFAHPNMASHAAVVEMPVEGKERSDLYECRIMAQPGCLRGEFIMVVSAPWVSTGVGTSVELLMEMAPLVQSWLDYMEGSAMISIDFNK